MKRSDPFYIILHDLSLAEQSLTQVFEDSFKNEDDLKNCSFRPKKIKFIKKKCPCRNCIQRLHYPAFAAFLKHHVGTRNSALKTGDWSFKGYKVGTKDLGIGNRE